MSNSTKGSSRNPPKTGQAVAASDEAGEISLTRGENLVLVLDTPKGRGVFASKDIPAKTVLEVSPVLVLDPVENSEHICKTDLYNYTYNWPYMPPIPAKVQQEASPKSKITTTQAVIFGLGSMFNHSTMFQNVGWERDVTKLVITYTSLRDIKAGEELCISYGDVGRLTFKDADHARMEAEKDPDDWTDMLDIIDYID
ncbi:hypothetical protein BJ878DRAFT_25632 [Calycina marina]|uniref:SET domain-containing protein n=1 Tax=Calycina marina TaxID=1763456 RepID=A0A9P7Z4T4_9HELO|nr:hypothetical protein BJ878DRAFT_25632 [Calycina marina]